MKIKHFKVTREQVENYFLSMDLKDYLYKAYPICEAASELNMPVWDYCIMHIKEGTFRYKGTKVTLIENGL